MPKIRIAFTGDDPKKPSPLELLAQNKFAKDFAKRKGLIIGENAHVGKEGAKFIDAATGKETTGQSSLPPNTIVDIRKIPTSVKELSLDNNNIPYYQDAATGDIRYVHPDIARSARFNPNRGKTNLLSYAKL